MTLKEIKRDFPLVLKQKKEYIVFEEGGKRSLYKYCATLLKKKDSFCVKGFPFTKKIEKLREQIEEYHKSLKYDVEYYNPTLRAGVFEELIVHDYLRSLGFKSIGDDFYIYVVKSIYRTQVTKISICVEGLSDFPVVKDSISISLYTGDTNTFWINTKVERDADKIILGINSLLKPLLLTEAASHIQIGSDMEMGKVEFILEQIEGMDIKRKDIKEHIKARLLEVANQL